jgi:Flp pilus assembly protein TadB
MVLMEIALFFLIAAGVFFLYVSLTKWVSSRSQLKRPTTTQYTFLRDADRRLRLVIFKGKERWDQRFLRRQLDKWDTWSEIATGKPFSLAAYLIQALFLMTLLVSSTWIYSHSWFPSLVAAVVGMAGPLAILRARFLRVTHRARRHGLLPFIDVYKHAYIRASENVITAFHLTEPDCPAAMRPVLEWFLRRLHNGSSQREGLREFAVVLHSEWAHVFVNYLISGLEGEAQNITRSLSQLQNEMYRLRDEEEERDMITQGAFYGNFVIIGITFLGVLFLCLLMPKMKEFYVQSDTGRALLVLALFTWMAMIGYSYFRMKGGENG